MNKNTAHKLPFVAIVGKPNVGKSSLFNRLVGRKIAIIAEEAGTTRDRVFQRTMIERIPAIVVDTGGLEFKEQPDLEKNMQAQAHLAIQEADLVLFIIDGRKDPTADDYETTKILRTQSKHVILVANKIDNNELSHNLLTWTELGLGEPISISVIHNFGMEKLGRVIAEHLEQDGWEPEEEATEYTPHPVRLAFIGRPNAGKSSLVNSILGENRVIVSDIPGTTRDAIDIEFTWENQPYTIIDTAGLRRRGKIAPGIEKWSSFRTIDAIERADIVCLVLDYSVGIRAQDLHISSYILDANKGLIILINKSDLMSDAEVERNRLNHLLQKRFAFLTWAPILYVSAKNHRNLNLILDTVSEIHEERQKQIDHDDLLEFIKEAYHKHQPPTVGRKRLYFYELIQIPSATPTFEFHVNFPEILHFAYQRYLENDFRAAFGFNGTALRFFFKPIEKKFLNKLKPL